MNTRDNLFIPGTELHEIKFDGFWDWLITINNPAILWKFLPTYVLVEVVYIFGAICTFIHAMVRGGRLPYLWFGILLHGFWIEILTYISPDIDNFWHSQTTVIFWGRRLPLHIIFLYPCMSYNAAIAAAKLHLPKWAEPVAAGLLEVLIDIPYDIVSIKFVHWTWHDTDPNIYDRHYWVPWNSYFFHFAFGASFNFWFNFLKRSFCKSEGQFLCGSSKLKEVLTTLIAVPLGPIGGVLLLILIYHPLHDVFKIHSEVTFFIVFSISLLIVWIGDRISRSSRTGLGINFKTHWSTFLLIAHLVAHYAIFLIICIFFNPENEISTGLKETVGPCNEYIPLQTVSGRVLERRKYLCATDYDEKYFDWSCLPNKKPPSYGAIWYTTCGTPYENKIEYVVIISLLTFLASVIFYTLHFKSYGDGVFSLKGRPQIDNKKNIKSKKL